MIKYDSLCLYTGLLMVISSSQLKSQSIEAETFLLVEAIGKEYTPDSARLAAYQPQSNMGGSTSVRNVDEENLEWKSQGYFQRNRDLGQVFTPQRNFRLNAIVLRTGPSDKAVLAGTPGARVFVQFFEVTGTPAINNNGTPPGTDAKHGFSKNHRCDDFIDGVEYKPLLVVKGGKFPDIPVSFEGDSAVNGDAGRLYYMRWAFGGKALQFSAGKKYAFVVGLEDAAEGVGFTLANHNTAGVDAPPSMDDEFDAYGGGWGIRREGDGTIPPTMLATATRPTDHTLLTRLQNESMFGSGEERFSLAPTTDGYPDVDTYRDLTFALEVTWTDR